MPGHTIKDFRQDAAKILKNATWQVQSHEFILMPSPKDKIDPNNQASIHRFRKYCQIFIHDCLDGSFTVSSRYKNKNGKYRYRFKYNLPNKNIPSRFYWMLDIQPDSSQNSRVHAHIMIINRDLKTHHAMSANYYGIRHIRKAIHHATIEFNQLPAIKRHPKYKISDIAQYKSERKPTKNIQSIINALRESLASIKIKSIKALQNKLSERNIEMKYVRPSKKRKHTGFKFRLTTKEISRRKHRVHTVKHRWIWSSRLRHFKDASQYNMDGIKHILSNHRKAYARKKYQSNHQHHKQNISQLLPASNSSEVSIQPSIELKLSAPKSSSNAISSSSSAMPKVEPESNPKISIIYLASVHSSEVASAEIYYPYSANQKFRSIAKNYEFSRKKVDSELSTKIFKLKEQLITKPEWTVAKNKYKHFNKRINSLKNTEASNIKRIMPKFHNDFSRQYSYWYYQNAPEIFTAHLQGYNNHGIPKFGLNRKDNSWLHKLIHPISKGFQQRQHWIYQRWQHGKKAITKWMNEHHISHNIKFTDNNNIINTRNLKLADLERYYNKSILHKLFRPITNETHSIIKGIDKKLRKCADKVQKSSHTEEVSMSESEHSLSGNAASASSASSSQGSFISGQISYYTFIKQDNNSLDNINSYRQSIVRSTNDDASASITSVKQDVPIDNKLFNGNVADISNSNASSAMNAVNNYANNHPIIKKYKKDLGINNMEVLLHRKFHKNEARTKSKSTNNFVNNSSKRLKKRIAEHQRRNHSNNHSFNNGINRD